MTAVVAPVAARCHHAMWDEEPGRQGASAIVSKSASEESSASSGWAQQEVALDAHGYPQPVRQQRGERQFRVVTVTYGGDAETSTIGNKRSARSFERIIESEVGVMTFG